MRGTTWSVLALLGWAGGAAITAGCLGRDLAASERSPDLELLDENNYTYAPTLVMADIEVQSEADATVDWSGLTVDLRTRPVVPSTVEQVYLSEYIVGLDQAELITKFQTNALYATDTEDTYIFDNTSGVTSAPLSAFEILSDPFDPAAFQENPDRVWVLSLVNHPRNANDVLQTKFVTPLDSASNSDITFTNDCSTLVADVNLDDGIPPVQTLSGADSYSLGWDGLTTGVFGNPFDPLVGDTLQIGHFNVGSASELETLFLRLDLEADQFYRLDVYGRTSVSDLAEATDDAGNPFPGFSTDGVWVVAIACNTCVAPAPQFLSIVDVE